MPQGFDALERIRLKQDQISWFAHIDRAQQTLLIKCPGALPVPVSSAQGKVDSILLRQSYPPHASLLAMPVRSRMLLLVICFTCHHAVAADRQWYSLTIDGNRVGYAWHDHDRPSLWEARKSRRARLGVPPLVAPFSPSLS